MKAKKKIISPSSQIIPVILSGGIGSRLWPLSRSSLPKQYLKLQEDNENTLLQNTYLRLLGIKDLQNPLIICNEAQRFLVAEQMREINVTPQSIVLEPFGRSTAPAIALSALMALEHKKVDPILLILSADHEINNKKKFQEIISEGIKHAEGERLVTFGVSPTKAETGYGYIEALENLDGNCRVSRIKKFIEKPSKELADKFLKDKHYFWNSGIFLFKASVILKELKRFFPEIVDYCSKSLSQNKKDLDFRRINSEFFKLCPNVSIDIAVMEKSSLGSIIPLNNVGWSDIGNWETIWERSEKDIHGNTLTGNTYVKNTKNCYLRSENRLIVGLGIRDLIIIETNDALLVTNKESTQLVKDIVNELSKSNFKEVEFSKKVHRPWGNFISIENGKSWQVKRLEIRPGQSLSLQLHKHRAEHWVVVNGIAKVEINGKESFLKKNESIFVGVGKKHRLSNPSSNPLIIIEVQSGSYLGEDDIKRFEDKYGREN